MDTYGQMYLCIYHIIAENYHLPFSAATHGGNA